MKNWNTLQEEFVYAEVSAELTCDRCRKKDFVMGWDEEDCYSNLVKKGWKSYNDYCYCPKCVKQLKKICKGEKS